MIWLRSPSDAVVSVHSSDKGKVAIYERHGWRRFAPVGVSLTDMLALGEGDSDG